MFNLYSANARETQELIVKLSDEVGWSSEELLNHVRQSLGSSVERMTDRNVNGMLLGTIFDEVTAMDPGGHDMRKLLHNLISEAPFKISMDNLDHHGAVMIYCNSQILATHDQSIAGSMWECPGDMDVAYAMPCDHPGLLEELKSEGYVINEDNYSPPDCAGT